MVAKHSGDVGGSYDNPFACLGKGARRDCWKLLAFTRPNCPLSFCIPSLVRLAHLDVFWCTQVIQYTVRHFIMGFVSKLTDRASPCEKAGLCGAVV